MQTHANLALFICSEQLPMQYLRKPAPRCPGGGGAAGGGVGGGGGRGGGWGGGVGGVGGGRRLRGIVLL